LEDDELGGEGSALGTKGNANRILVGKREERDHLAYLGLDGK
jgi:hypothetical protein